MGSDESHFNVSLIVWDKVTRQCPQTTTLCKRKESRSGIEPRSFCLPAQRLTARPNRLRPYELTTNSLRHTPTSLCPWRKGRRARNRLIFGAAASIWRHVVSHHKTNSINPKLCPELSKFALITRRKRHRAKNSPANVIERVQLHPQSGC